jgi:BT1 family
MTVEIEKSVTPPASSSARSSMTRLLWFFALVYVAEGSGGLISQPLNYYLKQVHDWTPLQISAYVTILNLPWMTKSLYGLVSDLIPLFGYRRKSYLLLANATAIVGLLLAIQLTVPDQLVFALLLTAFATAISSAVSGAVLVENGQQLHESGTFVNQQWLWYTISAMTVAVLGGQLVERFEPTTALHSAAAIAACAPLLVIFGTVFLVPEKKAPMNIQGMKYTLEELLDAFRGPRLWIIAAFIFLYYFSPGLSTPLYFVMTDSLKFSQAYIDSLGVVAGCGWILGSFLYRRYFWNIDAQEIAQPEYCDWDGEWPGVLVSLERAGCRYHKLLFGLCRNADHRRYAHARRRLFSARCGRLHFRSPHVNHQSCDRVFQYLGSYLFTNVFDSKLAPLVVLSAGFTAFAFVLVPLLQLGDKRQGVPAAAAITGV